MSQHRYWRLILLTVLGASIGAIGIVFLIRTLQKRQPQSEESSLARPAASAIMLKPISQPRALQRRPLPLAISAEPTRFKRGLTGTIRVKTVPGAACTVTVTYSTGSAPASLRANTTTADEQGMCVWSWQVGTSGSYADVQVQAEAEGYDQASVKRRVNIVE